MTAKTVQDLFLEDDLRWLGAVDVADAVRGCQTHEEVDKLIDGMQWLVDWANQL